MPSFPLDLTLRAGALVLSRPQDQDADDLVAACGDPETVRFTRVPSPYTHEHARGFVTGCADGALDGSSLGLLVRDAEGRLLASCGLVRVDWPDLVAHVGYWVAPWARRGGVATAATRAVCRYAFDAGIERLHLEAASINEGSNEVARRLGFVHEGTLRSGAVDRAPGAPAQRRFDMNVWGLLPDELS